MTFEKELLKAMTAYKPISANWLIFEEIINKYKLDKQKVEEAIEKHSHYDRDCYAYIDEEELRKELGL